MFVLCERRTRPGEAQGDAEQDLSKGEMGHTGGSSARRSALILRGVIGDEDNVFAGPARGCRKCTQAAVPDHEGLRFNGNAHKLPEAADRLRNRGVKVVANSTQ